MPLGNRTGPEGMGPMTGRAAGFCAGYNSPGYANAAFGGGRGFGRGRGYGRGGGRGYGRGVAFAPGTPYPQAYAAPSNEQELSALKDQQTYLDEASKDLKKRIDELESRE